LITKYGARYPAVFATALVIAFVRFLAARSSSSGRPGSIGRRAINDFEHRLAGSDQLGRSGSKRVNLLGRWLSLSAMDPLKFEPNRVKRRARFLFRLQG
jgi:hypothetical protein